MHNLTPHLHYGEIGAAQQEEEHQKEQDIFDWLAMSFHKDLGEGHLECFSQADPLDLSNDVQVILPFNFPGIHDFAGLKIQETAFVSGPWVHRQEDTLPEICLSGFLLRGPPRYA